MKLTTHLQLVARSRKCGSIHPLPHTSSWRYAQGQIYVFKDKKPHFNLMHLKREDDDGRKNEFKEDTGIMTGKNQKKTSNGRKRVGHGDNYRDTVLTQTLTWNLIFGKCSVITTTCSLFSACTCSYVTAEYADIQADTHKSLHFRCKRIHLINLHQTLEVEVNLRPTVSRPVCLGVRRSSGTSDQFFVLLEISFRELGLFYFVAPSLTRGRVCNLLVQLFLGLARAVTLGSKSRRTHGHILLSHLRLTQPGGPGSRIYIRQEQGGPVIPPGHWVPFMSPLTTRMDYGGGILTRLHTGKSEIFLLYHI
jgi:hypothetical protein